MAERIKCRAFLAIPLGELFSSELNCLFADLQKNQWPVRWVKLENLHVTFHFFGEISPEKVPVVSEITRPLAARYPGPLIFLEGWGGFPDRVRPRVVWCGVKGELALLSQIQSSLELQFKTAGFPCEGRDFKPHLTLGRIKSPDFDLISRGISFTATEPRRINELILFESRLTSQGASYEKLASYPFRSAKNR